MARFTQQTLPDAAEAVRELSQAREGIEASLKSAEKRRSAAERLQVLHDMGPQPPDQLVNLISALVVLDPKWFEEQVTNKDEFFKHVKILEKVLEEADIGITFIVSLREE